MSLKGYSKADEGQRKMKAERQDQSTSSYRVFAIDTPRALSEMRPVWDDLHRLDQHSDLYLSYPWIAQILTANPGRWRVYAVQSNGPSSRIVCLFPAAVKHRISRSTGIQKTEISPAGRLTLSDRTGFLCHPDYVETGLTALAQHIAKEDWSRFSMRYEPTQTRARHFASAFDPKRFRVSWKSYFINDSKTNYLVCPKVSLPDDFDTYLSTKMSAQTRRSMRRAMRKHIDSGDTHITTATDQTLQSDLATLFDLWALRWAKEYDDRTLARVIRRHRRFFLYAQNINAFRLTILRRGSRAIGAEASIVDRAHGRLIAKMGARDPTTTIPVGNMLLLNEIRWAITNGFDVFDLGHGDAPYKYSFGAEDQEVSYFSIRRRS